MHLPIPIVCHLWAWPGASSFQTSYNYIMQVLTAKRTGGLQPQPAAGVRAHGVFPLNACACLTYDTPTSLIFTCRHGRWQTGDITQASLPSCSLMCNDFHKSPGFFLCQSRQQLSGACRKKNIPTCPRSGIFWLHYRAQRCNNSRGGVDSGWY